MKGIEHFESLVSVGFQFPIEFVHFGELGNSLGKEHQQFLGFSDGGDGDVIDVGIIHLDDLIGYVLQTLMVAVVHGLVERVVAHFEIFLEMFQNLDFAAYIHRHGDVVCKQLFQCDGRERQDSLVFRNSLNDNPAHFVHRPVCATGLPRYSPS